MHNSRPTYLITALIIILLGFVYWIYFFLTQKAEIDLVTRFTIPPNQQHQVGEVFPVKIQLEGIPHPINIVQADLAYDQNALEIIDLDLHDTLLHFLVQKEINAEQGYVRVTGGIPNPGYSRDSGLVATLYLRSKQPGVYELIYLSSSLVLANDGQGTNLLTTFPRIPLLIIPRDGTMPPITQDLTIKTPSTNDLDQTIMSFTQYAHDLPDPILDIP